MCGICGYVGREQAPDVLERMNGRLLHRGPDDDGFFRSGAVNLAMRRLSIVDLETGRQPIGNEDGSVVVVFNGEIYNHVELRRDLEARHRFATDHADTEVIVHLYEELGERWPERVNGMFAVALWDQRRGRLMLFRDRLGKKPLYYAVRGETLVFGSELKALLEHPDVSRELDYRALWDYFGLKATAGPATAFRDVRHLPPGHLLEWSSGRAAVRPYWQADFGRPLDLPEPEAAAHLAELLEDAVRLRMRCDAPFGAYLSGGVDSSAVVALMVRHVSRPLETFCLGYEEPAAGQFTGKADDVAWAREMSRRLGTSHHELHLTARDFAEGMPSVLEAFDEPFSGTVSTFFLSALIRRHVVVALSGDGADELFGSYLPHRLAFPLEAWGRLSAAGARTLDDLTPGQLRSLQPFDTPGEFARLLEVAREGPGRWRSRLDVFPTAERRELLSPEFLARAGDPDDRTPYDDLEPRLTGRDALNRCLEVDQRLLLPDQVLAFVDRLSMAHSVEVRCPYLDTRIVEFANRLPGALKIRDGVVKRVHRLAVEPLLPEGILRRPKEGFVQPIYSWMRGALKGWVLDHLAALPRHLFVDRSVAALRRAFESGSTAVDARIWNLVCFSLWWRRHGRD